MVKETGKLVVAMLQLHSYGLDQAKNLKKGLSYCEKAKALGADIVLFPEMWNMGYELKSLGQDIKIWESAAITLGDCFVRSYQEKAKSLEIAIAITYLNKTAAGLANTVTIIDRFGRIILSYDKVHTCDFAEEQMCCPGSDFYVCELDTVKGSVKIGAVICYDREFPESARILMLKGAEMILVPNACELDNNRLSQIQTRAFENMVGVAVANYVGSGFGGKSVAFDGMAYDKDGRSLDMLLAQGGDDEGIILAEFDIAALREYRHRETWGDAYRKPECYTALTENSSVEEFIREDAKR